MITATILTLIAVAFLASQAVRLVRFLLVTRPAVPSVET